MTRPRLFLDTNVLVSAVLFGGVPGALVDAARGGRVEAVVSLHVLSEFIEVLTRPRFGVDEPTAMALAEEIALFARVIPLVVASGTWVSDADDDPVIEAAIAGGATHVVTGDLRIHQVEVEGLEVITAAEALRAIEEAEAG
jgi:putative PIN family toxin of toxin-antitoxin system